MLIANPRASRAACPDALQRIMTIAAAVPSVYRQCVGDAADAVPARQRDWPKPNRAAAVA
ncbi:hypothetical protein [Burkholderia sp. IDO3]|uniref:hypothetical protein n=1 Tax=Burkholderia sp. IDO3 TaxID=1705310 RepID=UPI000BBADEC2|nr:hypothetical protein [Burkholderia sp. IDO3]AXK63685.1 hypothetical protein DCN14_14285 [Burkholderia sp. IDO3]PCD57240.1 hypothetical protein CN645_35190 [Burkholderia sp. IDO3]